MKREIEKNKADSSLRKKEIADRRKSARSTMKNEIERTIRDIKGKATVMFTHYYRQSDPGTKSLIASSCIIMDEDYRALARGWSLVSKKDNPSKIEGRFISMTRAMAALKSNSNLFPVRRREAVRVRRILSREFLGKKLEWKGEILPKTLSTIENERIKEALRRKIKK